MEFNVANYSRNVNLVQYLLTVAFNYYNCTRKYQKLTTWIKTWWSA